MDSNIDIGGSSQMDYVDVDKFKSINKAGDKMEKTLSFWKWNYQVLLKPQVLIFTAIVNDLLTNVVVIDIMKQLVSLDLVNNVKALFQLSNKAFTFVEFSDANSALKFQKLSNVINGVKIAFVNPEPPKKFINIFIEKLPVYLLKEYLPNILKEWGEVISIVPTYMKLLNGNDCETGSCKVKFKLNNDITTADIPYFIKIDRLKIYVHIPQRPKICFRCMATDHLVSNCSFRFCHSCRAYKGVSHVCLQSYAQKVSNSLNTWHASLLQAQEDCLVSEHAFMDNSNVKLPDSSEKSMANSSTESDVVELVQEQTRLGGKNNTNVSLIGSTVKESFDILNSKKCDNATVQGENILVNEVIEAVKDPSRVMEKAMPQQLQNKKRLAVDTLTSKTKKKLLMEITKSYSLRNKTDMQNMSCSSGGDSIPMDYSNSSPMVNTLVDDDHS